MNIAATRGRTAGTERMRPVDAMWHWLSTKFATDQFLVYAFAGVPESIDRAVDEVMRRAQASPHFGLRIGRQRVQLRFPQWVPGPIDAAEHRVIDTVGLPTWQHFLAELAQMMKHQLDPHRSTWRLHVFGEIRGVPGGSGASTVVVLQMSHALGDGTRTAALAGWLFGRSTGPAPVVPLETGGRIRRIADDYRAQRQLRRDEAAGVVPPANEAVPARSVNRPPTGDAVLRTVARHPGQFPGPTVLVGALVAVSEALSGHLRERGEDASQLAADVAIAKPGKPRAHNHFDTYSVGLYPELPAADERVQRIVADLMAVRRRASHPAAAAGAAGFDAIPALLRRAGVWRLRADIGASEVNANTVVSSVDRGAADLTFGGCPVILTSSYPSLMPMMGLTHGVHRIGDTIAVSVHTTESIIGDIDGYVDRLERALRYEV